MDLKNVRRDYEQGRLCRESLNNDPMQQFATWFQAAKDHPSQTDPTAFVLASVGSDGQPHQRVVLLKDIEPNGFVFFTNYDSQKGHDIAANNRVSMHFGWLAIEQQVRIEGFARKISREASAEYFYSRPRESQLGALASAQSHPIASRAELEQRFHDLEATYKDQQVPMPEQWGGYLIVPEKFEFWQGGRYRLHDRFTFTQQQQQWHIERIQP
ncbi:pyridoxamine 5'-phosphate oxidase [Pseudidiomarina donghaiensis]|uniref:pyridoxamine 5'-phosphate oxidase n=1 Tax=Pseudidiomarina donghaiensis TaxID=519452 RepID=UPI003A97DB72